MIELEKDKMYKIGNFVIVFDSDETDTLKVTATEGNILLKPMMSNSIRIVNTDLKEKKEIPKYLEVNQ